MFNLVQETLNAAKREAESVKERLGELYYQTLAEDGELYNRALQNAYADACKLVMSIDLMFNAQIDNQELKGGEKR
jgi:hypothetical protein